MIEKKLRPDWKRDDETDERRVRDDRSSERSSAEDEDFPADRQDVPDESGDEEYRRGGYVPSRRTRSMNGRLFMTYSCV